jgi:hypothetical protein
MSERDEMMREELADGCRGVNFNVKFIIKAVRAIRSMPAGYTPRVVSELAETEAALAEALLAVRLMRAELDTKPLAIMEMA